MRKIRRSAVAGLLQIWRCRPCDSHMWSSAPCVGTGVVVNTVPCESVPSDFIH